MALLDLLSVGVTTFYYPPPKVEGYSFGVVCPSDCLSSNLLVSPLLISPEGTTSLPPSVRHSVCPKKSGSCDNAKSAKARLMILAM